MPAEQAQGHLEGAARDPARDPRPRLQRRRPGDAVVVLLRRRRRAAGREARAHREDLASGGWSRRPSSRSTPWSAPARGRSGRWRRPARRGTSTSSTSTSCSPSRSASRRRHRASGDGRDAGVGRLDDARARRSSRTVPRRAEQILTPSKPGPATTARASRRRSRCTAGPSGCPTSRRAARRQHRGGRGGRADRQRRCGVPVVPRDGGTGLTDGAVPLRGGIVVDVKRMNQINELDLVNRTVTVGTGINMLKLNERLGPARADLSRRPGVLPVLAGRRPDRHQRLVADRLALRAHARPGAELRPRAADRRGDARRRRRSARKVSKSSSGYQLKHLFMGHQGTLGIATEATLKLFPKPEAELSPFWAFDDYDDALRAALGALARAGVRDVRRRRALRRVRRSPTCGATTRPTSRSPTTCARWSAR